MFRIYTVLAIASVGVASAGQIQIGGVNGLTSTYVTSGCSGVGPCISGSSGGFTEQNYDSVLFSGASNGVNTPTPYSTYSTGNANQGTIADPASSETFAMINDGVKVGGGSRNVWIGSTSSPTLDTITVPIGVFGVSDVWTMLNTDLALANPARDLTIEFDFASTSNGAPTTQLKIKTDNNTPASGTVATDGIQNAVQCPLSSACSTLANGAPSSSIVTPGVTILSDQLLSTNFAYTIATGGYSGTTGNVELDDQGFVFTGSTLATALSSYLVDIKISEANASGSDTLGLSAITLDAVTTPEPSTVLMLLAGLGAIGFGRLRSKQS
jgi:hypothetical protein